MSKNNAKKSLGIPENVSGKSLGNSQDISRNLSGISQDFPKTFPENSDKVPKTFVVNKPKNSENYDVNTLDYCCKILEHLVVGDGGSIKLIAQGLVLKSNPGLPVFRLKYCPNCGTKIEHSDTDFVEKSVPEVKEILRDKP